MERRNWSLEALKQLVYADSLDPDQRANALTQWHNKYLVDNKITDFDLELDDLKILEELLFKSINFLKVHKEDTRQELLKINKMKRFLKN